MNKSPRPNRYKCSYCDYEGHCFGQPTSQGVSAPWCKQCEKNDGLTHIPYTEQEKFGIIVKKIKMNVRRLDQWMGDNEIKSPRVIKVADSLEQMVKMIKEWT